MTIDRCFARWLPAGGLTAALLVLAGCGGGGGSDPKVVVPTGIRAAVASAGADLTADNAKAVTAPLIRTLAGAGADSFVPLRASGRDQATAVRKGGALSASRLDGMVRQALGQVVLRERIAQSQSLGCPGGGSMLVTALDNDADGQLGPGDGIAITVYSCVIEAGMPPANGGFTMTVNVIEGKGQNIVGLDVSAQFSNFNVEGHGSINGNFRMWSRGIEGNATVRLSYMGTLSTEIVNGVSNIVVYDFDTYTQTSSGVGTVQVSGGVGILGQVYVIETISPLVGTDTPTAGALRLKDAQGDFAQITARSATSFDLDFYLASNPTVPALSLPGQLWSDYEL